MRCFHVFSLCMQNSRSIRVIFKGSPQTRKRLVSTIFTMHVSCVTDFHYTYMTRDTDGVGVCFLCRRRIYLCFVYNLSLAVCAAACCSMFVSCLSKANFKHQPTNQQKEEEKNLPPDTCLINICKLFLAIWTSEKCFSELPLGRRHEALVDWILFSFFLFGWCSANVDWRLVLCELQKVSPVRKPLIGPFVYEKRTTRRCSFGRPLSSIFIAPDTAHTSHTHDDMVSLDRQIFKHKLIPTHVTFRVNSIQIRCVYKWFFARNKQPLPGKVAAKILSIKIY